MSKIGQNSGYIIHAFGHSEDSCNNRPPQVHPSGMGNSRDHTHM